jgi:hypothetical protein
MYYSMCRYRGYVPTMKFSYGETYGNQTNKYFQDFRSTTLDASKTNYCKGGYFPTYYTHSPELGTEERMHRWDRWLNTPRYTLSNRDHDRQEDLIKFGKVGDRLYMIIFLTCALRYYCSWLWLTENTTMIRVEKCTKLSISTSRQKPRTNSGSTFHCE